MDKVKDYKDYLLRLLNEAIEESNKIFPHFGKGEIEKRGDEHNNIFLTYVVGKCDLVPKQNYLRIDITGIFYEDEVEIFYDFKIADNSRPFLWSAFKKFNSNYSHINPFSRWMLIKLREREKEIKDKFNYIFDYHVKVIGDYGITEPSKELFKIIVDGMIKLNKSPVLIIEISHATERDQWGKMFKSVSFAVYDNYDWLLFPDFCNEGDSGGGGAGYFDLKKFLEERKNKIIWWNKDMDEKEFVKKVKEYTPVKFKKYLPREGYKTLIKNFIFNEFLDKIINEINNCFNEKLYLACGLLIRKIIEESLIQKKMEIIGEENERELRKSHVSALLKDDDIKKPVNNQHILTQINNIYHLESEGAVHGVPKFNPDSLIIESRIVESFLDRLFPKKIRDDDPDTLVLE